MRKMLVIFSILLLSILLFVPAAMAIGPDQAVEVGNNPNIDVEGTIWALENPSDVRISWSSETGRINHWINAEPAQGIMNNVAYSIGTRLQLAYYGQHQRDYENQWVYFSGESAGGTWISPNDPSVGPHGAIYWMHRSLGLNHEQSLQIALERPYGAYLRSHWVG